MTAAHDLFVERAGNGATVSDIAGRAQVNVAMVKYCFGNKDGMLDALLERVLDGLSGEIQQLAELDLPPDEKLRRHVAEIIRNYVRYPYVNRLMNERLLSADPGAVDRISASFAGPAREWYAQLLQDGQRLCGWRQIDPTLFFFIVVGVCEFLFSARPLLERAFGAHLDPPLLAQFIDHVTAFVTVGLIAAPEAVKGADG